MLVTHPHSLANWSATLARSSGGTTLNYWMLGGLFTAAYVLIERVTFVYQLDGLGITLWSPSAGISVIILLLAGTRFAPFVFVASVITDYVIYTGPRGLFAPVGTSLVLAIGLAGLALALTATWNARRVNLTRVLTTLAIVPAGTFVTAILYCLVLYACELLSLERFVVAVRNFWIGDTLGIITLLPAALTVLNVRTRYRVPSSGGLVNGLVFGILLIAALWIIFGLTKSQEYQFFYLLFIPVMWIAVRAGYAGASLGLPVVHVLIASIAMSVAYAVYDFIAFQMLMLVLSATGLLLGAAVTEARASAERMRTQESELARAARHALVGATGTALAHEISQPLASTTNYLHAARRILLAPGGNERRADAAEALAKAEAEARRVRETLERVRDYVSSGRVELSDVDIGGAVAKIVALLAREANARGVHIEIIGKPHLPTVRYDAIQVEQLLLNLIGNAVDAAGLGKDRQGRVSVRLLQRVDRLVVVVEDNGPGVAPRVADRLFEPFETTKRNGMGLGLTLARQIVEAHAGALSWENLPSGGARFTVELRIDGPPRHEQ
jgi:two-component system, LuxR family, sensor kinase FixL